MIKTAEVRSGWVLSHSQCLLYTHIYIIEGIAIAYLRTGLITEFLGQSCHGLKGLVSDKVEAMIETIIIWNGCS